MNTTSTTNERLGQPAWIDLGVPDLQPVKDFYSRVFGWTYAEAGEEYGFYNQILAADGSPVGGLMRNTDAADNERVFWQCYFATHDAAATLAAVEANGGSVVMPATQVGEMGTMGIALAPSGAQFGLWQPGRLEGFDMSHRHGVPEMFDSPSTDFDADLAFYREVFQCDLMLGEGEHSRSASVGPFETTQVCVFDRRVMFQDAGDSGWRVFFAVDDMERAVDAIREAGGQVTDGPESMDDGVIATAADPAGATFLLWQELHRP